MAAFIMNCPYCGMALQVQQDWIGMEMKCPSCNQSFVLPPPYAQPQYGQPPFPSQQYGVPFQGVGAQFQLMPGEVMILQKNMTRVIFPAGATEMRLTNQRLVFCHTSRVLTCLVSWIFFYVGSSTISQTFTRADIAEMHLENGFLGRKKVVLTDLKGEKFKYMGNGFSNATVNAIMQWYDAPR